jgi:hypothetical protein
MHIPIHVNIKAHTRALSHTAIKQGSDSQKKRIAPWHTPRHFLPSLFPSLAGLDQVLRSPELMRLIYVVLRNACRAPSHTHMRRTSGVAVREVILLLVKSIEVHLAERHNNNTDKQPSQGSDSNMSMCSRESMDNDACNDDAASSRANMAMNVEQDDATAAGSRHNDGSGRMVRGSAFHLLGGDNSDSRNMKCEEAKRYGGRCEEDDEEDEDVYEDDDDDETQTQAAEVFLNRGRKAHYRHDTFLLRPWICGHDGNPAHAGPCSQAASRSDGGKVHNVMDMIMACQVDTTNRDSNSNSGDVECILDVLLELKAQLPQADEYKLSAAIDELLAWLSSLDERCKAVIRTHPSQCGRDEGDASNKKASAEEEEKERRKSMAQARQRALLESMRLQQLEAAKHQQGLMHGDDEDEDEGEQDARGSGDYNMDGESEKWQDPLDALEGENCALCGEEMYAVKGIWQHMETSTATWMEYGERVNAEIEAAYTSGADSIQVVMSGECYELDFERMMQRGPIDEDEDTSSMLMCVCMYVCMHVHIIYMYIGDEHEDDSMSTLRVSVYVFHVRVHRQREANIKMIACTSKFVVSICISSVLYDYILLNKC